MSPTSLSFGSTGDTRTGHLGESPFVVGPISQLQLPTYLDFDGLYT